MNEYFLKKADENLPEIKRTKVRASTPLTVLDKGDSITVDFGNHYVGYLSFNMWFVNEYIDAPVTLRVRFFETKGEMDYDYSSYTGWLCESWIQEDTVKIDFPGVYSMPRRYAARYVTIEVLHTPKKLSLSDFVFEAVTSADESKLIPFKCGDEELNAVDRVAVNTLKNCMQRVFEDGPKRDRRLWIGDLRLEALANYYTFRDTALVKRCLYLFAASDKNSLGFLPGFVYETERMGTRSGVSIQSSSVPNRCDGMAMTLSSSMEMNAPIPRKWSIMALSPCSDSLFIPHIVNGCLPMTPATTQKAADDQSPSTTTRAGMRYCWPPFIRNILPLRSTDIPATRKASIVMSM